MNSISRFFRKLAFLFRRGRFRSELDEEMTFHREQAERELIGSGMAPADARFAARRRFGNAMRVREHAHVSVGFWFEHFVRDCRYAVRQVLRSPGYAFAVVATLTLGIGATSAIFTLVYSALLRSLPYPAADRIVRIEDVRRQGQSTAGLVGVPRFFDLQARANSFQSIGFFFFESATLIDGGRLPTAVREAGTSAGFWNVYGARPLLGRGIDARDDRPNGPEVAVLSFKAWQQLFGADPGVVGRHITLESKSTTIVGVMPRDFRVPGGIDLWRPAQFNPGEWNWRGDGTRFINVFALLKPGVSIASAQSDLDRIGAQLEREHFDTDGVWRFGARSLRDDLFGELRPALLTMWAASGVLLLLACFNISNLALTRATARRREVALRRALGASESRVCLQFVAETSLLAWLGGLAGLGAAYALVQTVSSRLPGRLGAPGAVQMNWSAVSFALAVTVIVGIAVGLAPALQSRNRALNPTLKQGDPRAGKGGGRNIFIAVQVGLSLVLLIAALLLAESLWKLVRSPLGFEPDHLLTFEITLPWSNNPSVAPNFFRSAEQRIESTPGVTAAGQIDALPTVDWHLRSNFDADWLPRVPNRPAIFAEDRNIAGDYLGAMGTPLIAGRAFTAQDQAPKSKSILVNQQLAQRYFPGGDPVGHRLIAGKDSFEIVGVVGDVRGTAGSIAKPPGPEVYWPADADGDVTQRYFVVRSRIPAEELIQSIQHQVHEVDPLQAIANVATMDDLLDRSVTQPRFNMGLMAAFAVIALLMACAGIYGVVAFSVAQRVQEIGVRMALGATRGRILALFVSRSGKSALIGAAAGIGAALPLTRLLRSQLYGIAPDDPLIYAASVVLLLIPVLLATLWPALKAAAVDPADALRAE